MARRVIAALPLLLLIVSSNAYSQAVGTLTGTVADADGAVLPGADVNALNVNTGVESNAVTNNAGAFNFPSLLPGTYELTASFPGFQTQTYENIALGTSETLRYNFDLAVAGGDVEVEVSVDAQTLLTSGGATIGEALTEQQITDLPMVRGEVLDLVYTLPGARRSPAGGVNDTFAGISAASVNTVRDGLSVSDGRFANGIFGTTTMNPDLVGEVRLILAPVDAEVGRGNGQVQIRTRSGTNDFRGAAVWNIRNSSLNANSWGNNNDVNAETGFWEPTQPDWFNQHQYTISFGGPIRRNQTFFFVLWDQQINNSRELVTATTLTGPARQGIFRYFEGWNNGNADSNTTGTTRPVVDFQGNPLFVAGGGDLRCFSVFGDLKADGSPFTAADCPGGTIVSSTAQTGNPYWDTFRQSMDSTGYIANFMSVMPEANDFTSGDGLNTAGHRWLRGSNVENPNNVGDSFGIAVGTNLNAERKQINVKIDHNFNQNHKVNGGFTVERTQGGVNVSNWPNGLSGLTTRRPWVLTSSFTSTISPTMVNEARFGVRKNVLEQQPPWESIDSEVRERAMEYWLTGSGDAPIVFYPSIFNGANHPSSGGSYNGNDTPLYSFGDTMSWTSGAHAYKFGGELRLTRTLGYNGIPAQPIPTATGGAGANTATGLNSNVIPGLRSTGGGNPQTAARDLLYFLSGSVGNVNQLYWIDDASDVENGTWEDYFTKERKIRDQVLNEFSWFVKDDWKVTSNLTLNLGLRYEWYGTPYIGSGFTTTTPGQGYGLFGAGRSGNADGNPFDSYLQPGGLFLAGYGPNGTLDCVSGVENPNGIPTSNCDPSLITSVEFVGPNSPNPDKKAHPTDTNNFGPAVGFAWQVPWFGAGQTTLRGGYQITYGGSGRNGIATDTALGGAPGATSNAALNQQPDYFAGTYFDLSNIGPYVPVVPQNPSVPGGTLGGVYSHDGTFTAYDPNLQTPYIQNFTLSLTRSLRRNMTMDLRYIGTVAKKQPGNLEVNLLNTFHNAELLEALNVTRAGGDAPLFDQLFAGLDLSTVPGYGTIGTTNADGVVQTGSLHLRQRFGDQLASGDYNAIAQFINSDAAGGQTQGELPLAFPGVGGRILRNGCDRLATGQTTVGQSIPTALRCFPENYLTSNPQFDAFETGFFAPTGPQYETNTATSNYHSLQAQFTLRPTFGTNFQATYTWSKTLAVPGDGYNDPLNRRADYATPFTHLTHDIRTNGRFELPFGPGQMLLGNSSGVLARLVEGWSTSWIFNWSSGQNQSITAQNMLFPNGGGVTGPHATPDVVGDWDIRTGDVVWGEDVGGANLGGAFIPGFQHVPDPQCRPGGILDVTDAMGVNLMNNCDMTAIADAGGNIVLQNALPGRRGTLGQRTIEGPSTWSFDLSMSKELQIRESMRLQIRMDATNILNHAQPNAPSLNINSTGTPFGFINGKGAVGEPRTFQAQVRVDF